MNTDQPNMNKKFCIQCAEITNNNTLKRIDKTTIQDTLCGILDANNIINNNFNLDCKKLIKMHKHNPGDIDKELIIFIQNNNDDSSSSSSDDDDD